MAEQCRKPGLWSQLISSKFLCICITKCFIQGFSKDYEINHPLGHVGVQWPYCCCCCQGHAHLCGLPSTQDHDESGPPAAAEDHVWVHGPATARISVDVHGPCCHWGPCKPYMLKSKGPTELDPPFIDPGRSDPAPWRLLQQESWR